MSSLSEVSPQMLGHAPPVPLRIRAGCTGRPSRLYIVRPAGQQRPPLWAAGPSRRHRSVIDITGGDELVARMPERGDRRVEVVRASDARCSRMAASRRARRWR